ncbi:hypothetical protein NCCP2716_05890 [Sporosarcina sp. NCCP-2716]|uniref:type II secretion system protein n=1 Tax=Sporosarcina sp. NCCP-2716 TaxID=2943679 RepID=UPI002040D744|nr:type II secretion system protein [Sporosarcina sp. NCCP-2716]GKV68091.1 hypothetical protein NCCP2716_05890 [Sporosarcina sp. NCCP-2716]
MRIADEAGMTFLELLLVLFIIGILTVIVLPVSKGWSSEQTEQDGIEAFKSTVQHMQSYSMANRARTWLTFSGGGTIYTVTYSDRADRRAASFPPSVALEPSSTFKEFGFNGNGDMLNTGTLSLRTENGAKQIKFQFQRGRMIIDE